MTVIRVVKSYICKYVPCSKSWVINALFKFLQGLNFFGELLRAGFLFLVRFFFIEFLWRLLWRGNSKKMKIFVVFNLVFGAAIRTVFFAEFISQNFCINELFFIAVCNKLCKKIHIMFLWNNHFCFNTKDLNFYIMQIWIFLRFRY